MQTSPIERMPDFSEIIRYERDGLPLYIATGDLSLHPNLCMPCHWHDDIEWIHVLGERMVYNVNGKSVVLNRNDTLMVNSRQMHYGYAHQGKDCLFSCVLFHPSLFCGNSLLLEKYVTPILENPDLEYLHFHAGQGVSQEAAEYISRATELKKDGKEAYELEVISVMQALWCRLLKHGCLTPGISGSNRHGDLEIQKSMVSFIYQHYGEKLTLDEIAASGHVSRSKCCLIFRQYVKQSPAEFLNAYRLKASYNQLRYTQKTISEIAYDCGFNHLSYFSKQFALCYGYTPREYRKKLERSGN